MKVCTICCLSKELTEFNNQKLGKFGKRSYCRLCQSEMRKQYNDENRKKLSEYQREYRKKNPSYNSDYQKNRRLTDINFRLMGNMRARICNVIQNKTTNTFACLGTTIDEFKKHLEKQFDVGMTWNNYGEWHVDHIVGVVFFDVATPANPATAEALIAIAILFADTRRPLLSTVNLVT